MCKCRRDILNTEEIWKRAAVLERLLAPVHIRAGPPNTVTIIECDMNVDFEAPPGYESGGAPAHGGGGGARAGQVP